MNEASAKVYPKRPEIKLSDKDIARFWTKVDKSGGVNSCWNWMAGKKLGYGAFKANGIQHTASKVAFILKNGQIPYHNSYHGFCVCHKCDNPACCNPDHLFLGTSDDNMRDMVNKGRSLFGDKNPSRTRPETRPRGKDHHYSRNPNLIKRGSENKSSKLNEEQVLKILEMRKMGMTCRFISKQFNVSNVIVSLICRREVWVHI